MHCLVLSFKPFIFSESNDSEFSTWLSKIEGFLYKFQFSFESDLILLHLFKFLYVFAHVWMDGRASPRGLAII